MHVQSAASASASAQGTAVAAAQARVGRAGSGGPKHSKGPKVSGGPRGPKHSKGPKVSGGPGRDNGLHLGQIKKLVGQIGAAAQGSGSSSGSAQVDVSALQALTSRLGDVMDRLGSLTDLVNQATAGATSSATSAGSTSAGGTTSAGATATTGTSGATSGAGGAGGAGGTGGAGSTSSAAPAPSINLLFPFQGPTDFGSITINGVTTEFGIIDATGGLSARQVTGSLVNIINGDPDQTVTAQQRDNKILLVSKEAGATISVDDISFGQTSGTTGGFAGFLDGMSGTGTLMSNPISPIVR
ncbi:MAG: hypothetical protein FJZ01_18310 [Candidatus Sericytochromatia bacterium]|nr:hypothetical protein [Candidatus Tanganyikabacteria bacterium]